MVATINRICGFETGDETELSIVGTGGNVADVFDRSGTFGFSPGTGLSAIDPFGAQVSDQGNDYIIGIAVRFFDKTPSSDSDFLLCSDGSGGNHIRLRLEQDGDLAIIDANNSVIRTINDPFTDNVYFFLELYWQRSASAAVELFIDGVSQGTDSAQDLLNGTAQFTSLDLFAAPPGSTAMDDIYVISGAAGSSDRLGGTDPFFEVFGYQSDKASAVPDDGGDNLQVGQWLDCGVVPFVTSSVAEYTSANAGAVDTDGTNGNPEGPLNDSRITGSIACIQGVWLMERSGGGGSLHFGLLGNNVDGATRSADFDPPQNNTGFFFLSESASIVPETDEYCRIGFETTGAQDFECFGQMAMLAHIPPAGGETTQQSISATMTGTASVAFIPTFIRAISATMTGTASFVKQVSKSISASMTGTASFVKGMFKAISAAMTGTATVGVARMFLKAISASMTGTASITRINTFARSISAAMTGTASIARISTFLRAISATMTGTATFVKQVSKSISASMTGTASIALAKTFTQAINAVMVGTATVAEQFIAGGVALIAQARSISRFVFSRVFGRVN